MQVRVILGDPKAKLGRMYARQGDRVYSYHPSNDEEPSMFVSSDTNGIAHEFGGDSPDATMLTASVISGTVDVIMIGQRKYRDLIPTLMKSGAYDPDKTRITFVG